MQKVQKILNSFLKNKNLPKMGQKSVQNQPKIGPKPAQNQPKIQVEKQF
jgi:hypothetical protein